jgi:hypothetical protein
MGSVTAVFHNGRVEFAQPVDWPDGTQVEVTPILHRRSIAGHKRATFPLHRSSQPGTLTVEQVRAAEEAVAQQEDASRAGTL